LEEIYLNKIIVSVDGASGSGKERIAKYIAKNYNLYHLDSGILYRRLAFLILKNKIDTKKNKNLIIFLKSIKSISSRTHLSLRKEYIGKETSKIAKLLIIRNFINAQQRKIVKNLKESYTGCVIDGRDIGSNVFKNARIKLFIRVKPEIRAKRRHKQLLEQGEKTIYSRILKDINLRDKTDINRNISPLVVPNNAIIIDNSSSFQKTVKQIKQTMKKISI
tara:strand:+ start:718 stop:1377 length:660 start_codon:yes stop_codon:yes gene_type:complete